MSPANAYSPANIWRTTYWAVGIGLGVWLVPAIVAKLIFHATTKQVAGPYLAFAALVVIFTLLALALRYWRDRGASRTLLPFAWALLSAAMVVVADGAYIYTGFALRVINSFEITGDVAFVISAQVLSVSATTYFVIRQKLSRQPE